MSVQLALLRSLSALRSSSACGCGLPRARGVNEQSRYARLNPCSSTVMRIATMFSRFVVWDISSTSTGDNWLFLRRRIAKSTMRRLLLPLFAFTLMATAQNTPTTRVPPSTPDLNELNQMIALGAPAPREVDLSGLPAGDKKALAKLIEAARLTNDVLR